MTLTGVSILNYKWITWVVLAALILISSLRQRPSSPLENQSAPTFSAPLLDGAQFDLEAQRGKVVVLDFWATWCNPCLTSLPALSAVAKRYANDSGVWVGSVNKERISARGLDRFLKRLKLEFPVIRDRGEISSKYQVRALPTLVIINPRGEVSYSQVGLYSSHTPTLIKHLSDRIEEARAQTP